MNSRPAPTWVRGRFITTNGWAFCRSRIVPARTTGFILLRRSARFSLSRKPKPSVSLWRRSKRFSSCASKTVPQVERQYPSRANPQAEWIATLRRFRGNAGRAPRPMPKRGKVGNFHRRIFLQVVEDKGRERSGALCWSAGWTGGACSPNSQSGIWGEHPHSAL